MSPEVNLIGAIFFGVGPNTSLKPSHIRAECLEIEKTVVLKSGQMVKNLLKNWYWGIALIFQPATSQNVIATNDAGGNSHILVTNDRRVMVHGKDTT